MDEIINFFLNQENFSDRFSMSIKRAIDWAIDTTYTGYNTISELSKTEKTVIGTKVEQVLRHDFKIPKGVNYPAPKEGGASVPTNSPSLTGLMSGQTAIPRFQRGVIPVAPRK